MAERSEDNKKECIDMKDYLDGVLENGEKVLWEGKPEPFELLEGSYKKSILTRWIILGAVYVALVGGYLAKSLGRGDSISNILMLIIVLTIFAVIILMAPISDRKALIANTKYVITDKRAIVINKDGAKAITLSKQTRCKVAHLENHTDVVFFGEACDVKENNSRSVAVKGLSSGKGKEITGIIFYGVNDAKELCMKNTPCYMV